jgi:hypothetical protein
MGGRTEKQEEIEVARRYGSTLVLAPLFARVYLWGLGTQTFPCWNTSVFKRGGEEGGGPSRVLVFPPRDSE